MGYSPLPPREDGSKAPLADIRGDDGGMTWKPYQDTPATRARVEAWYRNGRTGVGVCGGPGGLEPFEFDVRETYERFKEAAAAVGLGDLVERIEGGYCEESPGGGVHWMYLCDEIRGPTKLAERPIPGEPHRRKTLIETKGQGGFIIVAPSCGKVHPSGGAYRLLRGRVDLIATITSEERQALWDLARTFDEMPSAPPPPAGKRARKAEEARPGDIFEADHTWEDILEPLGWAKVFTRGDTTYWRRPGKDSGVSATTGHCKGFYAFSTSTSFEARKSYTKFGMYAHLHHGGDHAAAARELAKQGGGRRGAPASNGTPPPPSSTGKPHDDSKPDGEPHDDSKPDGEKQPQILMRLAGGASFFHDPERRPYAIIPVNGHQEVHPLHSNGFKLWLKRRFYDEQGRPPSAQAFQDALGVIEARAQFDGEEESVHIRVAGDSGRIFIDLADDSWQILEITAKGWTIRADAAIRFRRPAGLRPLPHPQRGGTIADLKPFLNCDDVDFLLLVAWMAAAMRPVGPYPVLVLTGEQGAAKSTLARMLRKLIDNHVSLIRAEPTDARDLVISAFNSRVIALDNVSYLPPWLSDALCRLATGGGFATRTYYTMDEETYLDAQRPVILTGIEDFVSREDLIDRGLFIHLPAIPDESRQTEKAIWDAFDAAAPRLAGALCDLVAKALRRLPKVSLSPLPRMADFALFGEAISQAMGNTAGYFAEVYRDARQSANESAAEDSSVVAAIQTLLNRRRSGWEGTAKELLQELSEIVGEKQVEKETKSKTWPKGPRAMGGSLRRLAPTLKAVGIRVDFEDRSNKRRPIKLFIMESGQEPAG
jgi:hypothetical protein